MIKVLLVEDDPEQIFLYDKVFSVRGLFVMAATTTAEALTMAASDGPDIILLDIMLRHENGLDIMETLKQREATKNIPVVVFTNTNKKEFRERAEKLGAADFIIKSQTIPQEMAERIKKMLGRTE